MADYANTSEENLTSYQETRKPFYVRHKRWVICGGVTLIFLVIFLPVLFLVIIPKIIQGIVDASAISFTSASLSNVTVTSFRLSGNGTISNSGSIPATITTENPIILSWNGKNLGSLPGLPPISAGQGGDVALSINDIVSVSNEDNFANFAAYLLNNKNFTWTLTTSVTVTALGIPFKGISLNKTVTLNAANQFSNVAIQSFDIPGDTSDGKGISLVVNTAITNPSDIDFDLGDVTFSLYYSEQQIGSLVGKAVKLAKGPNTLSLTGSLTTTTPDGLAAVGKLFSNYIKGQASLTKVVGSSATNNNINIPWLSSSLKSLELVVALPGKALPLITSISLGDTDVDITPETAYSPILTAPSIRATYQLPFPFTAVPLQAGQALTLYNTDGGAIGSLTTALAPVQTSNEPFVILLGVSAPLVAIDNGNFENFFSEVTNTESVSFGLKGTVDTVVRTAIGEVKLTGVPVDVSTSLSGLNGLKSTPVSIANVVVIGGDANGITINTDTGLNNPSTSKIILNSDAVFDLFFQDAKIGVVTLPWLTLDRGANNVGAVVYYSPVRGAEAAGKAFLTGYVTNQALTVTIRGNADTTTSIDSLRSAFSQISLDAGIPVLGKTVVAGAALSIPANIAQTSIAKSAVTVNNPFAAQLAILTIDSDIKYSGRTIGAIRNADLRSNPIVVPGTSTVTREGIDVKLNTGVGDIVWLLETAAKANNVDLGILKTLLDLLLQITGSTTDPARAAAAQFTAEDKAAGTRGSRLPAKRDVALVERADEDITALIFKALAGLKVDLDITSTLKVGDYQTSLSFPQNGIPATLDNSVLKLIGAVGGPLVQYIVDQSTLSFSSTELRDLADTGFALKAIGKISNTGPLTANIKFTQPVQVAWLKPDGSALPLGSLPLPDITAVPAGADLNTDGRFSISNVGNFAQFTGYMLKSKEFTWQITTDYATVNALENTFTNVKLNKKVTLAGFNGLDQLTISNFDLPSDDPAGGISLNINAVLVNPSSVSIELGKLTFENYFKGELVGPVTTDGSVFLQGNSNNALSLKGRITPRTGTADTVALAELFGLYLSGQPAPLTVRGKDVTPPNGNYVNWLVPVFKQLELTVSLPGENPIKPLVKSIAINDFNLDFKSGAFNPLTTSTNIVAAFLPPFGFPINVVSVAQELTVYHHDVAIATISVPFNDAKTDISTNLITTGISANGGTPPRFAVIPGAEAAYIGFIGETLQSASSTFGLKGKLNSYALTGAGRLPLFGLPLDVSTTIVGFNNFGGTVKSDVVSFFLDDTIARTTVRSILPSDSPVTVIAGKVKFQIQYTGIGTYNPENAGKVITLGDATIEDLTITKGDNAAVASAGFDIAGVLPEMVIFEFIDSFIFNGAGVAVDIVGTEDSTDIPSLKPVFAKIRLATSIKYNGEGLRQGGSIIDQLARIGIRPRTNTTTTIPSTASPTAAATGSPVPASPTAEASSSPAPSASPDANTNSTAGSIDLSVGLQSASSPSAISRSIYTVACAAVIGLMMAAF
ncbi:hypothetical protein BJ742DRAFT_742327 [Cladochytrium replicatum]|nr:hypothetical protein BJ742DRAFT_742327 [Cladochytrium replicatum]